MSFDIYCYRSSSGIPDATEAEALVEAVNAAEEAEVVRESSSAMKDKVVSALLDFNPRLQRHALDYGKVAEFEKISEVEARTKYQYVELNPPDDEVAIQLTVHDDYVFVTMPYWYRGDEADKAFSQLSGYLRVIRRSAGFLAYDPQSGEAFDPEQTELRGQAQYQEVVEKLPGLVDEVAAHKGRKIGLTILLLALLVPAISMFYSRTKSTSLDGWWLKQAGGTEMPDEMTLKTENGTFNLRHWDSGGVRTIKFQLDGLEHPLSDYTEPSTGHRTIRTYRAHFEGDLLLVEMGFAWQPSKTAPKLRPLRDSWTETWSIGSDGQLKISISNAGEYSFRRAPWLHRLLRGKP